MGVGEGRAFLHRYHPLWEALGVKEGTVNFSIFQDAAAWNAGRHTLVTPLETQAARNFVQYGLCEFSTHVLTQLRRFCDALLTHVDFHSIRITHIMICISHDSTYGMFCFYMIPHMVF